MTRPRRLYTTADGKFYYLIDGKKKFVKAPSGVSQKQIAKINIRNIVNAPTTKRIKRRRKRIEPAYGAKVGSVLAQSTTGGLPLYFFKPKKQIPTLQDQAEASADTTIDKLTKSILKLVPSSSKIEPTVQRPPVPQLPSAETTPSSTAPATPKNQPVILEEILSDIKKISKIMNKDPKTPEDILSYKQILKKIGEKSNLNEDETKRIIQQYGADPELLGTYQETVARNLFLNPTTTIENISESGKKIGESKGKITISRPPDIITSTTEPEPVVSQNLKGVITQPPAEPQLETTAKSKDDIPDTKISNFDKAMNLVDQGGAGADDGLYNDEIEKIVKKRIKNYVPVIASDEINQLPRYVGRGDKRFGFIINTNPSTSDGSGNDGYRTGHWRAVYINNEDDYPTVEYFDPLAEGKMPKELVSICRKIAMKMNPSMMFKYKQNMLQRQSKLTSNCGYHSIKFLDDRYNGVPWSEATGYDNYMAEHSSAPDDSHDGEKDISKYIKKYESYI